jgi:hypothetical protein
MPDLTFILAGDKAADAADPLAGVLTEGASVPVSRRPAASLPETARRVVDPISLAALILSVPAAVLASADLVQRIAKRRKAKALISEAQRLRDETQVETYVLLPDGTPRAVLTLDADGVLEIAAAIEAPKASE